MGTLECESARQQPIRDFNLNIVAWFVTAANLAMIVLLGNWIWGHNGANHTQSDPRWLWILPGLSLVVFLIGLLRKAFSKRPAWAFGGAVFITMLALFVVDFFNLMDHYEVWISRGMPERWHH